MSATELKKYITARIGEFDQIPAERKQQLQKLTLYVRGRAEADLPARRTETARS